MNGTRGKEAARLLREAARLLKTAARRKKRAPLKKRAFALNLAELEKTARGEWWYA